MKTYNQNPYPLPSTVKTKVISFHGKSSMLTMRYPEQRIIVSGMMNDSRYRIVQPSGKTVQSGFYNNGVVPLMNLQSGYYLLSV